MSEQISKGISPYTAEFPVPGRSGTPFSGYPQFEPPRRVTLAGGVWNQPITVSRPSILFVESCNFTGEVPSSATTAIRPSLEYVPGQRASNNIFVYHGRGRNAACLFQGPGPWSVRPVFELVTGQDTETPAYAETTEFVVNCLLLDASHPLALEKLAIEGGPRMRPPFVTSAATGAVVGGTLVFPTNPWRRAVCIQNMDITNLNVFTVITNNITLAQLEAGMNITLTGDDLYTGEIRISGTGTLTAAAIAAWEETE